MSRTMCVQSRRLSRALGENDVKGANVKKMTTTKAAMMTWATVTLLGMIAPHPAHAAGAPTMQATAPAGGGLAALSVTVDLKAGEVRAGAEKIPIALGHSLMPDVGATDVVTEVVSIGEGKHVVHVRVPAKGASGAPNHLAWEAVLAAGHAPIFAGVTGFASGEDGERTGKMVQVLPKDDGTSFVIVARVEESTRICGQALTPLAPEVLNAKALELRGATVQRLGREQREAAKRVVAVAKGAPADTPLARLLVATGTSVPNNTGGAVTDGNPDTAWSEQRPGAGQGEFVLMRAPAEVPLTKLAIVVAPPKTGAAAATSTGASTSMGAAPKSFFLVTDTQTLAVTMPEDAWMHPGAAYEIALAEPLRAACLTLVLDEAYTQGNARPDVSVAELYAYSEFDGPGASLEKTAAALAGGGARGGAAAGVLKRAGDGALASVESVFEKLDVPGRALAADIAVSASSCDASAAILVRAMVDPAPEVSRKGRLKLERCGKSATAGLVQSLRTNAKGRVLVAPMLAMLAPEAALDPLAEVMGDGPPEARSAVRSAFARASKAATKEKLGAMIADTKRPADARVDLLRASTVRIRDVAPEANAAIAELLQNAPPMRVRYLLVGPIAELARGGDAAAAARLVELLARDPEWPVRARAAEAAEKMSGAVDALVRASHDPEPRVREAALLAIGPSDAA